MTALFPAFLLTALAALGWIHLRLRRQDRRQAARIQALEARRQDGLENERELSGEVDRLRRAERDLRQSEEFNRALFQATQTGLMIVNTGSKQIMEVNESGAAVLGCNADDVIGDLADRYMPCPEDGSCYVEQDDQYRNQSLQFRRRDGSAVPVLCSITRLSREDSSLVVVSFLDISEQQEHERQLRESNLQLAQVNGQLQAHKNQIVQSEKLASVGQLAAGLASELDQPLAAVTDNLGTIQEHVDTMAALLGLYVRRDALDPAEAALAALQSRQIAAILAEEDLPAVLQDAEALMNESMAEIKRIADVVQNLQSFARTDARDRRPHDLNEGVAAMIDMTADRFPAGCRVERLLGEVPALTCHPGQINQVIMNLLVNAGQALGAGGGTITVATGVTGDEIEIRIADTGKGIPPEALPRIFDPFFTTKEAGQGTGLGLSISHGIVQDHDGRIEVDSDPGRGSEFRVYLPLAGCPAAAVLG